MEIIDSAESGAQDAVDNLDGAEATEEPITTRVLLARKVTDIVVLPAKRISANQRSLAADILLQVLGAVEDPLRVEIATRVARVSECPPALLRMLLLDDPAVAEPILTSADSVPEALLIECARHGVQAHRAMIARRLDLTTSIADVLVECGEADVAKILLQRDEFNLSPNAVDLLVARSASEIDLQPLLLRRRELEPAHGFMMFWWVEGERRRRIFSRFALDRTIVQDALQDLYPPVFAAQSPDPLVKGILIMNERRHRPRGVNGEAVEMDVVVKTLALSRRNSAPEIVEALGMLGGVSRDLASRILRDTQGEAFAVLSKSLGVPRDEFFAFLTQENVSEPITAERAEEILAFFDSMARDFARAVLRYWDWDGNPRIARIMGLLSLDEGVGWNEAGA